MDMTFSIYPNDSPATYHNHIIDEPLGLETDLVILFYDEDDLSERHKGAHTTSERRMASKVCQKIVYI